MAALGSPTSVWQTFQVAFLTPTTVRLLILYLLVVVTFTALLCSRSRKWQKSPIARVAGYLFIVLHLFGLALLSTVYAQASIATSSVTPGATATTSHKPQFTVPAEADEGANLLPNILDPQAVNAQTVCPGYTASNVHNTSRGLTADLTIAGPACNLYGNDVVDLKLVVEHQSASRLHIEITPTYLDASNSSWFLLPDVLVPKPTIEEDTASAASDLTITWNNDPTFSFTVTRQSTGDVLFTTAGSVIIYEDQFIEFGSSLPENYNLYGLGEVIHGFRLGNNFTRTLYAADAPDPIDGNIYGSHAFYLDTRYFEVDETTGVLTYIANASDPAKTYKSYSHGSFLRNAHAMEVVMRPENITWRALGGNIDLYFYAGPTQVEVTKQYQLSTVGLPAMQQYWTLGFHQCRWGYRNWTELQEVVDDFKKFEIPLDGIWTDIDYMNQYRDFDNDRTTFGYEEGGRFLDGIHANEQHWIPIIDSAIYIPNPQNESDAYSTFDRGNATDSFMLNPDGSLYIGAVWPGYTVFPDFIGATLAGKGAHEWWVEEMVRWHQHIAFDGAWIDMSEVSSFCVGSCGSGNTTLNPVHPPFKLPGEPLNIQYDYPEGFELTNSSEAASVSSASSSQAAAQSSLAGPQPTATTPYLRTTPTPGVRNINHPPYVVNNIQGDLAVHAVSPNATHHDGSVEYDYHNLFGHQILNATYAALLKLFPGKRPFIIGRSTFAGSGKWAGHWGGDNESKFFYMSMAIPQALSSSLFGIPMFGTDTCGFHGNADAELCSRWMQLSAFFPFYRNHNVLSTLPQEPYRWASVAAASRAAMRIRYALLPYIYTALHAAHTGGATVMRALAWEFPDEPALADADRQFLLGPAVMVTPVLTQGAASVDGVFPGVGAGAVWYDWYTRAAVEAAPAENMTIAAPLGHIPVYVRGGYVVPLQEPALTTAAGRRSPWGLLVALDKSGAAAGNLYVDDGESLVPNATLSVEFSASNARLSASPSGTFVDGNALANVTVLGVETQPPNVTLNGVLHKGSWTWDSGSKALAVTGLNSATAGGAWAEGWVLEW